MKRFFFIFIFFCDARKSLSFLSLNKILQPRLAGLLQGLLGQLFRELPFLGGGAVE